MGLQNIIGMNFAICRLCNYVLHFWNWSWSWHELREYPKLWGGLCILYCSYTVAFAPPYKYGTKYTSLTRVLGTPSSHSNFNSNFKNVTHNCTTYKLQSSLHLCAIPFWREVCNYVVHFWNWLWNWSWSWNDLRECQKLSGSLCILRSSYCGGLRPLIMTRDRSERIGEYLFLFQNPTKDRHYPQK